jgi:cytochrome P450
MRSQSGKEKEAYLTTTGANHFGFGHGNHACPGRFFAANELKIATCHILLKYDWELVPDTNTEPIMNGLMTNSNPAATIRIRRRQHVELDIDNL